MLFSRLCASQHDLSFTISVKKNRHDNATTKPAFQQILCFSAWPASQHLSFTISIKKIGMIMSQQNMLFSRLCASQHDLLLSISCKFHHWYLAPWFILAPWIKGKCLLSTSAGSQTLVKLLQGRKPDAVKNPSYQCRKPDTGQVASAPETRRCEKPLVPVPEARHWSSCFSAGNQTLWKTLSTSAGSQTLVKLLQRRKPDAVENPSYQCRKPDTGQVASAPETRRCEKLVPVPEARHWSSCFSAGNQTLWKTLSTSAGGQALSICYDLIGAL